ncbi:MAG: DUF1080 domain-containing protein [bacterium]|nr:DUF1080 domain-containing protein [bacterium]
MTFATLLAPIALLAQDTGELTDRFQLPDGLEASLWAESPQLFNPTAIDIDAEGRVWVAEAVNYRSWGDRNPGRRHPEGDRVVVLQDTDGDGRCDRSTVFAQDKDLTAPLGIAVIGDEVFVSCSPHIFAYRDTDGDLVADERRTFLTGFGGFDHDHGVHSVTPGPDGALYLAAGNAGPHVVTDAGGFTLRSGSLYTGGSPYNRENQAGLVSDDGHTWVGGLMLRVERDGTGLAVLAHNFRNPYEVAIDSFGNAFTSDNDDDGNAGCRTTWIVDGGNYGYFSSDGSRSWKADRRPDQETWSAHWHQDDPGVMPAGTGNGAGGPTGVCIYETSGPDDPMAPIDGAVLNADAGAGVVYAHMPMRRTAGLELERGILIGRTDASGRTADDGRGSWFRPSDVAVAPDGSILVADWWDPGVGGHAARDAEAYGRLIRLAPQGTDASLGRVDLREGRLASALASPNVAARAAALEKLSANPTAHAAALRALVGHPNLRVAARALWPLAHAGVESRAFVEQVTHHPSAAMRIAAFRALLRAGADQGELAQRLARDTSPAVRLEVAVSLRNTPWESARPLLLALANLYEGEDRHYLEALGIGATGKERELFDALQEQSKGRIFASARMADIAWRLHPESAAAEFAAAAMDAGGDAHVRARALDALAFMDSREAANAMLDTALAGPPDLRARASAWVRTRSRGEWRAYDLAAQMPRADFERARKLWSSEVLSEGRVDFDVDLVGATTLWLAVNDGGNGLGCDWADWIDPRIETAAGEVALIELAWISAETGWGQVRIGKNANGGKLRIGDETFARGIGTHATSRIAYRLPDGALRLRGSCGPDRGGTDQGCGTSIQFEVWADEPQAAGRLRALQTTVADATLPLERRQAAVEALASEPSGGLFLIRLAERGELDQALRDVAAPAIFKNPDIGVRALASAHFERPGAAGLAPLPPVAEIAALDGDASRGAQLFFSERSQCSACHVFDGRGGDVGPELTRIRTKYDRAQLLDSILNPSAGIVLGFETYLFETHEGVLYSGFLLADGDDVLIKDTQGRRHVLARDEIAARTPQALSTMPEGVGLGFTAQELADLTSFLTVDTRREPKFGPPVELFDGASLDGWTFHLSGKDADPANVWLARDGVLRCEGKPAGYIRTEADFTNYELTLEWRFDPERGPGNSGVLLRMVGTDKVWPKSIEAQLQSRHAGDIWNIDHFPMQVDPARTQGRRTRKLLPTNEVPLGGWNRYRIVLDHGELVLEVNGVVQNLGRWCEEVPGKICLQSEGAYIEFRNIRLRPIVN